MNLYRAIRGVAVVFCKLFYRVEVIGKENEPEKGGCIAIANHTSYFDPLAVACALKRDVHFMGKSDLEKHKFLKWIFKVCKVVAVHRGESDMAALRKSISVINEGEIMGVFPQGTRIKCSSPDAETALAGIGLMAMRTKAPILPLAICYGKKNTSPRIFRKVRVVIGTPLSYAEYSSACGDNTGSAEMAKYAFSKVCEEFAKYNG